MHDDARICRTPRRAARSAAVVALVLCAAIALAATGTPLFRPLGQQMGEQFGYSVAGRGDVNGDGFSDVVVGAPLFDSLGVIDRGRVVVYYGGNSPDEAADKILLGAAANDHFGWSVAVGRVNADNFADIIVGAPLADAAGVDAGSAYVYFGGNNPDAIADAVLTGAAAGDHFGWSVSAGDVRKNALDDIIVGSPLNDAPGADAGSAYVYLGGSPPDGIADITLSGEAAGDNFGWSVASAPDVNGDLIDDIIVGAPLHEGGGTTDSGKGYVYFGDTAPTSVPSVTYIGAPPALGGHFGWSVAGAGQFSADALGDVVIGAPLEDPVAGADAGKAYVYYGASNVASLMLTGVAAFDNFGRSVAGAGDTDLSGTTDIIVGSPLNDAAGVDAGRADVFFGGAGADVASDVALLGESSSDEFGHAVASAGRVNGDATDDVVVGAPLHDAHGAPDAGRAYIFIVTFDAASVPFLSPASTVALVSLLGAILLHLRRHGLRGSPAL